MAPLPHDPAFDATLALLRDPYRYLGHRARSLSANAFSLRLMLRPATAVSGMEAVRMFYAPDRFTRRGAVPATTARQLQGQGTVQTLDGAAHRHRRALFLAILAERSAGALVDAFETAWRDRWAAASGGDEIALLDLAEAALGEAALGWVGLRLDPAERMLRTHELSRVIEGAGSAGWRALRGLVARERIERWATGVIEAVRADPQTAPDPSPLRAIALHRETDSLVLDVQIAARELLNLLRPTVAVGRVVMFAAHALASEPDRRAHLRDGTAAHRRAFALEVRRFYPFFPMIAGLALVPFDWREHRFEPGDRVLLDLYGTDHDAQRFAEPDRFRADRFLDDPDAAGAIVPQGGGDMLAGHRCPGEPATQALLERAVGLLVETPDWEVTSRDRGLRMGRAPATLPDGLRVRVTRRA